MKKLTLFFAILIGLATMTATAQSVYKPMYTSTTSNVDSVRCISTTPNYLYIPLTQNYSAGSFQANVTRVSTAIGGSILLQGSNDGTNYFNASFNTGDTATVANSTTQSLLIRVRESDGFPYKYYRIKCTGASSDTMTVKAYFHGRY